MLVRAYGAQISDCISAAFGDIPGEATGIPPTDARANFSFNPRAKR
jgi:hypothetical protein